MTRLLRPPLTAEDIAQEEATLLATLVRNCEKRAELDAQGSPDTRCYICPSCTLMAIPARNRLLFAATLRVRLCAEEYDCDPGLPR